jgi:hypothetical protein
LERVIFVERHLAAYQSGVIWQLVVSIESGVLFQQLEGEVVALT